MDNIPKVPLCGTVVVGEEVMKQLDTGSSSEKDLKKVSSALICVGMIVAGFATVFAFTATNVVAAVELTVTGTDLAPPEGVFAADNNISMIGLTLTPADEAVGVTSLTLGLTATSSVADADISRIYIFDDYNNNHQVDQNELEYANYGVLSSQANPTFPITMTLSGYSVGPFNAKGILVFINVSAGSEGETVGIELTGIACDDPTPTIDPSVVSSDTKIKTVFWHDEMEGGENGWTYDGPHGYWHQTSMLHLSYVLSPTTSWYYGNETTYKYYHPDGRTWGNLYTPPIDLSGYSAPGMSFWHDLVTEGNPNYDEGRISIEDTSNPGVWDEIELLYLSQNWTKGSYDLSSYAGKTIRVRFFFDTIDGGNNWFKGWNVDRFYVFGSVEANDVAVQDFSAPNYALPTDIVDVDANIANLGQGAENNGSAGVDAWLKIDGAYVQNTNIPSIPLGGSEPVSFQWTPGATGDYDVCIHAWPVSGETATGDNEVCKTIKVRDVPVRKIVIVRSMGTKSGVVINTWKDLNANWEMYGPTPLEIDWDTLNKTDITYSEIAASGADVLIVSISAQLGLAQAWSELTYSEIAAIKQYTVEGHGLIATGTTFYWSIPNNDALTDMFGIVNQTYEYYEDIEDDLNHESAGHPLLTNVAADPFTIGQNKSVAPQDDSTWDDTDLRPGSLGGIYVARSGGYTTALVEFKQLVYFSWLPEWFGNTVDLQILYNAMAWSEYQVVAHDVAMSSLVGPERVKPTPPMDITATLTNLAGVVEDNATAGMDVVLKEDGVVVGSTNIPSLGAGMSTDVTLTWNPPATPGTYNICMEVMQVSGETDTSNNEVCKPIEVVSENVIIVQILDSWGTDNPGMAPWDDINTNWATYGIYRVIIDYTYLDKEDIDALDLIYSSADVLMISSSNETGLPTSEFTNAEITAIRDYVNAGHGILGTGTTLNTQFLINNNQLAPLFGMTGTFSDTSGVTDYQVLDPGHTVFYNVPDPFTTVSGISCVPGLVGPDPSGWTAGHLLPGAEYLANSTPMPSMGAIIANDTGVFRGLYLTNMYELSSSSNDKQLLYNSMVWAGGKTLYPPVPPDPPQDLRISVVGADLQLDWTVVTPEPDVRFNIFKSDTVDGFNFGFPDAQVPAPPWTDPGAAADTSNHFYVVRAINISSSLTETNTNKVGKFYNSFHKGTNDISIPFILHDTSVDVVFASVAADISRVSVYDSLTGAWLSWVPGVGGPLTDVDNTQGIRVISDKNNVDFVTVGKVPDNTTIDLTIITDDWFFVGYPNLLSTPGALPDVLDNNGLAGLYLMVLYYDPTDRKNPWKWFDPNDPGGSPLQGLDTGKGYWILMIANGTWTVPGE